MDTTSVAPRRHLQGQFGGLLSKDCQDPILVTSVIEISTTTPRSGLPARMLYCQAQGIVPMSSPKSESLSRGTSKGATLTLFLLLRSRCYSDSDLFSDISHHFGLMVGNIAKGPSNLRPDLWPNLRKKPRFIDRHLRGGDEQLVHTTSGYPIRDGSRALAKIRHVDVSSHNPDCLDKNEAFELLIPFAGLPSMRSLSGCFLDALHYCWDYPEHRQCSDIKTINFEHCGIDSG